MIQQLTANWVCWAILLLAAWAYQQLWVDYLILARKSAADTDGQNDPECAAPAHNRRTIAIMISALPLMGLFGTITGLQTSFTGMMLGGADNQLVASGIGSALLTTQLGLVLAIPGWILLVFVNSKSRRATHTAAMIETHV